MPFNSSVLKWKGIWKKNPRKVIREKNMSRRKDYLKIKALEILTPL
jgi:hypothetical protein